MITYGLFNYNNDNVRSIIIHLSSHTAPSLSSDADEIYPLNVDGFTFLGLGLLPDLGAKDTSQFYAVSQLSTPICTSVLREAVCPLPAEFQRQY